MLKKFINTIELINSVTCDSVTEKNTETVCKAMEFTHIDCGIDE